MKTKILVVDDERIMRESLAAWLEDGGYSVTAAASAREALEAARKDDYSIAVVDLKMPEMDGISLLKELKKKRPAIAVVIMTAYGEISTAVEAIRSGAQEYMLKPFSPEAIEVIIKKILDQQKLVLENIYLRDQLAKTYKLENIIGKSHTMQRVYELIRQVADTDVTVLIRGESGVGKELVAKAIHFQSPRRAQKFMAVSCGALPESLLESELFGHERGAFTGAVETRKGRFEVADGGTLFLDEVTEISPKTQVALLRVLQDGEFFRVGSSEPLRANVRILAATNRVIEDEVAAGRFREDLYYRLNVVPIRVPPLREKKDDIPLLMEHFLALHNARLKKSIPDVSPEAMKVLMAYDWPGNIRELENALEYAMIVEKTDSILPGSLPQRVREGTPSPQSSVEGSTLTAEIARLEKMLVTSALAKTSGIKKEAARLLGISQRNLSYYLKKHGL